MPEPFVGEIRMFSFNYSPRDWALCDGRELSIAQYQALYSLLGTTFGGNGTTTFCLPDLRGRVPRHPDGSTPQGARSGSEDVSLSSAELPPHVHQVMASSATGNQTSFDNALIAKASGAAHVYGPATTLQALNHQSIAPAGGSQPHPNCQPSLVGNYCIALNGIYPSRN